MAPTLTTKKITEGLTTQTARKEQMMLREMMARTGDSEDYPKAQAMIRAVAVGLFAAQFNGLLRFPAGQLTIGEIESKLSYCVDATCTKLLEVADSDG